ncbi:MAG: hypothetical protein ACP5KP_03965 [Candidatus Micrarchaeia archaeon]
MRRMLFLLLLFTLSFAANPENWERSSILAMLIAALLITFVYAGGIAFESDGLKLAAKQEAYEWITTLGMFALFLFVVSLIDQFSAGAASYWFPHENLDSIPTPKHINFAINISERLLSEQAILLSQIATISKAISDESTKSFSCSAIYAGFELNPCMGFNAFSNPLNMYGATVGASIATTNSQIFLLKLTPPFVLLIVFPLGIFMRCFAVSRGLGGFLLSLAFGLYFVYPLMIVFMYGVTTNYQAINTLNPIINVDTSNIKCKATNIGISPSVDPARDAMDATRTMVYADYSGAVFLVLVKSMFSEGVSLLVLISLIGASSKAFGAEVYAFVLAQLEKIA